MGLKLLKLTATELSERAGITSRTLRNIENGEADSEISRDRAGSSLPAGSFSNAWGPNIARYLKALRPRA
ncbi:helix-turn-helix domain-containing protein [Vreelandella titanicae]|uniref:Helix-turn-helix transcriptional regulator n=1 Tax=Vreelandella titanicae TaxID=664683 RepID=A0A558JBB5_9GAMM|nr:helix-turn-helix transcriptional regulator [Halomonas titanicae]TVU90929.1 helix-turn-helix transcriptional regulator [Halomonas titanicae]